MQFAPDRRGEQSRAYEVELLLDRGRRRGNSARGIVDERLVLDDGEIERADQNAAQQVRT